MHFDCAVHLRWLFDLAILISLIDVPSLKWNIFLEVALVASLGFD